MDSSRRNMLGLMGGAMVAGFAASTLTAPKLGYAAGEAPAPTRGPANRVYKVMANDFDSPSYFPGTAAVKLGFYKKYGVNAEFVEEYGARGGIEKLRDGQIDFIGGPIFTATRAFPLFRGAKILCCFGQYAYWFMGIRKDIDIKRGDLKAMKGMRIAASWAFPYDGLRYMLSEAGLDMDHEEVKIVESLPTPTDNHSHDGINAIKADHAEAFWGNGMRLLLAERAGLAKLHIDCRRGDGPKGTRFYNCGALATTEKLTKETPEVAEAAIRAVIDAQKALKADPSLAAKVAIEFMPKEEAELMPILIERDAPFYDPKVTEDAVNGISKMLYAARITNRTLEYKKVVATQFSKVWDEGMKIDPKL